MPQEEAADIWALSDLRTPWCVHVAATLRIADHIVAGASRIDELAAAAACDAYALHRVLTHLASKGVFEEPTPGWFTLNDAARQLLDPIVRVSLDLDDFGGRMAHAWGTLLTYARTGEPAYETVFGLPFWQDLESHPAIRATFDRLMGPEGHGVPSADFQISGGWEPVRSVVDVGGGSGAMLAEILRLHPAIRGTLVDRPQTVAHSGEVFRAAGVSDRATAVGQSFFDPLPPGADLYLLKKVLNDWPDPGALAILRRCAEAARPAGRIVVLSSVTPDGAPRPLTIEMVLLGGKHRSVSEFRELALEAGLELVSAGQQPPGFSVIECRPI